MEKALFSSIMRKASFMSYLVGIFAIGSSIVQSIVSSSALGPIEAAIVSGSYDPSLITQISEALTSILPLTIIVLGITLFLTVFFAYYTFKVGQIYEIGSIKIAGPAYVIMELAILPVVLAAYELFPLLPALISDPSAVLPQLMSILILLLVSSLLALVFLIIFVVAFCVGLHHMDTETGISLFGTAMVLVIIGIVLSLANSVFTGMGLPISPGTLVLQISIILFGVALGRAGSEGKFPKRLRERVATEET